MKQKISSDQYREMERQPRFSLIIPYSIAMRKPELLLNILNSAGERSEKVILGKYTKDQARKVIQNLRDALKKVEGIPGEKTLAIFVSEFSKKIYYFTPTKKLYQPPVFVQKHK